MSTLLAVQMYTLREFCKTPADIASTCKRIAAMGWKAVQASALGPIDPKALKTILDDNGLACIATHKSLAQLKDVQAMLDEHETLGCKYTAVGGFFPKPEDFNKANWEKFIAEFNEVASHYAGKSLRIGYHNHSHEWAKVGPAMADPIAFEMLVDKLDDAVFFEVDTYWVAHGGGNPAAWLKKLTGRVPVLHFKDLGIKPNCEHYMMEVGEGNLDWPGILAAAKAAGAEHYAVEQDVCYRDPFDSLETSLRNLKAMGLS